MISTIITHDISAIFTHDLGDIQAMTFVLPIYVLIVTVGVDLGPLDWIGSGGALQQVKFAEIFAEI